MILRLAFLVLSTALPSTRAPLPPFAAGPRDDGAVNVALDVGFDPRLGTALPLDARFRDESGDETSLGRLLDGRPVVLALVYYECPMLCNLILDGLVRALREVPLAPGEDFQVIAISIDPTETPAAAERRRDALLEREGWDASGWHFWVGETAEIRRVADAAGFRYAYDAAREEYAHASGILVATPEGVLSHAFFGVDYRGDHLRLALVEASSGEIGTLADRLLLLCFHYDPTRGRYGLAIQRALRVGGIGTVLALAAGVTCMRRRERAREGVGRVP